MSLFRSRARSRPAGEEENPYLVSFSDLMAGLLAIFILALIALMIRLDQQTSKAQDTRKQVEQAISELARIEEIRREMLEEMKKKLARDGIRVEVSDNHSVLSIPEWQLHFESGKYEIPPDSAEILTRIGQVLAVALKRGGRLGFIETIFIEGHTDSQPLSFAEMGNWGLSSYRSIAVWKHWTEDPGLLQVFLTMRNRQGKPLFSVSGYADTRRLVVPDDTPEDRQKNRRIDLRFTMRAPVTGDLVKMLDQFKDAGIE
jgi:flagellar motor protein MotB